MSLAQHCSLARWLACLWGCHNHRRNGDSLSALLWKQITCKWAALNLASCFDSSSRAERRGRAAHTEPQGNHCLMPRWTQSCVSLGLQPWVSHRVAACVIQGNHWTNVMLRSQEQTFVTMGVGRECNFCDFMDEASRISQGMYAFFQAHKTSHDRAFPYTVLVLGHRLYSTVTQIYVRVFT